MSEAVTLEDLIGSDPLPRTCNKCGASKPLYAEHCPVAKGEPHGRTCRACDNARSSRKTRRQKEVAAAVAKQPEATMPASAPAPKLPATTSKLDVTSALAAGVAAVNAGVLQRLFQYAGDPQSPHHEWSLKLIAERILPAKMFGELGLAAGGQSHSRGPSIQINVTPAVAPQQVSATITVKAIEKEQ